MADAPPGSATRGAGRSAWAERAVLAATCALAVGPSRLLPGGAAAGWPTRDLYDHAALLDVWALRVDEWNLPRGGVLVPPDPLAMIVALPLLPLLGRGAAYSWGVLAHLVGAAWGGYALGRRAGGSGLVAGAALALSPYLLGQAFSGETESAAIWPLALVALLLEAGRPGLAGLAGALGAVASWYTGAFCAAWIAAWALLRRGPGAWRAPAAMAAAVALPAALYARVLADPAELFRGPTLADYLERFPADLAGTSSDPAGWLGLAAGAGPHVDALGGAVLVLAAAGALGWRRDAGAGPRWWWVGAALAGLVLSLGPVLHVAGAAVAPWPPGRLQAALPVVGLMRLPRRWLGVSAVALAVLAGRGARRLPRAGLVLVVVEALWVAVPVRPAVDLSPPRIVRALRGAVLDLPPRTLGDDARGRYLAWQRVHRRPVPYALLMTAWSPELAAEPLVQAVAALDSRDPVARRRRAAEQFGQGDFARAVAEWRAGRRNAAEVEGAAGRLRSLGLEEVVLHRGLMEDADAERAEALLRRALGPPALVDGEGVLWRLSPVGAR